MSKASIENNKASNQRVPCWHVNADPQHIDPSEIAPVVLVHGFMGFEEAAGFEYFNGVKLTLQNKGYRILTPQLTPIEGSTERAQELYNYLQGESGLHEEAFFLIGHSQGGLDIRRALNRSASPSMNAIAAASIGTPHGGTNLADYYLKTGLKVFIQGPFRWVANWIYDDTRTPRKKNIEWPAQGKREHPKAKMNNSNLKRTMTTLSESFQAKEPKATSNIPFYSIAGLAGEPITHKLCRSGSIFPQRDVHDRINPLLQPSRIILQNHRSRFDTRFSDGLVPLGSQIYGDFLGCIPADHLEQVGLGQKRANTKTKYSHLKLIESLIQHMALRARGLSGLEKSCPLESSNDSMR